MSSEYPIFPKTHDLEQWLMEQTMHFPRSQRFVLAKRVQDAVPDFCAVLIEARKVDPVRRREVLLQADVVLETLRLQLRLCHELRLLSSGQYRHVSQIVVKVGKLLGSWRKGLAARR